MLRRWFVELNVPPVTTLQGRGWSVGHRDGSTPPRVASRPSTAASSSLQLAAEGLLTSRCTATVPSRTRPPGACVPAYAPSADGRGLCQRSSTRAAREGWPACLAACLATCCSVGLET
jgi:hypothetical protein